MPAGRIRVMAALTAVVEGTAIGWALGLGWAALFASVAAVTAADTLWGVLRRRSIGDLAGLELAGCLAVLIGVGADPVLGAMVAGACAAWLIRPDRRPVRPPATASLG